MQYRSDLGAALARVAALEYELAELRGEAAARKPPPPPAVSDPSVALETARLVREKAKLEGELRAANKRADQSEKALTGERDTISSLRERIKKLEQAHDLEKAARLEVERELKGGDTGKASRTVASRRDAMWRQATLATLMPAALLATSWDILRDAQHTQKRDAKNYAGALRMAKGGEPILVHPRVAGPGFAEVRVGPGMGEIMFTTQDAIVQPERPKRRKR